MTISTITACNLVSVSGVVEKYSSFNPNNQRTFSKDLRLLDNDSVYQRHADSIYIADFNDSKEDYKINDVVWKNNRLEYVSSLTGTVAKQPEEYENIDTDLNPDNWQSRYLEIGEFLTKYSTQYIVKTRTDNDIIYSYVFKLEGNKLKYYIKKGNKHPSSSYTYINIDGERCDKDFLELDNFYNFPLLRKEATYIPDMGGPAQCSSTIDATFYFYDNFTNNDILVTDYGYTIVAEAEVEDGRWSYFKLFTHSEENGTIIYKTLASLTDTEIEAEVYNGIFIPRTVIVRNNKLYIRTNIDTPQETKEVTDIQTEPLLSVNQIDWGWTFVEPSQKLAPLDTKAYTILEQNNAVKYTIESTDTFDMLAVGKLYASKVKIKINEKTYTFYPKCNFTKNGREYNRSLTAFYYLDTAYPKNTKVEITFYPLNSVVKLGIGVLGYKIPLGLTLKRFKIPPKDFGKYEQDDFGNVLYIDRVKLKRVTYYVDIATITQDSVLEDDNLDFTVDTLVELMGHICIIDANDNIQNLEYDNKSRYRSVSMIGRFRSPEIDKKDVENEDITANYTFTAEEIV